MAITGIYRATALRSAGNAQSWTAENVVLQNGEIGVETDTNRAKIGDGQTAWNSLAYIGASSGAVTSVAGRTGAVVLTVSDVTGVAAVASPAFTGTPTAPTATAGTNTTQLATTAFVSTAIAGIPGYVLPAATGSAIGGVKAAAHQAQATAWADSTAQTAFNALLTAMVNAGLML